MVIGHRRHTAVKYETFWIPTVIMDSLVVTGPAPFHPKVVSRPVGTAYNPEEIMKAYHVMRGLKTIRLQMNSSLKELTLFAPGSDQES